MNFCSNDGAFGPGSACRSLDFTVYFEHSILSITPDAIFLALTIARIWYLARKPSVLDRSSYIHLCAKLLSAALVIATAAATTGLLASHQTFQLPRITIVTLLMSYGMLKGLFGAAILRTYSAIGMQRNHANGARGLFSVYALFTASYLLLLIAEGVEKRRMYKPEYRSYSKESGSSVLTRSSFVWLLPLLWRGRSVKFGLDDLGDIPEQFKARESRAPLEAALKNSKSVDIERISEGIEYFHEIWASLLSIALGLVLLYSQANWAAFMPLAVIVLTISTASAAGGTMGKRQAKWLAATDRRIKLISSVISNLMPIKMSAYEKKLEEKVAKYREEEMKGAASFFTFLTIAVAISNAAGSLSALAVLGTYAGLVSRNPTIGSFNTVSIFTILTTVQILAVPLNFLGQSFPGLFAAYTSLQRINKFLMMDEKQLLPLMSETDDEKQQKMDGLLKLEHASLAWSKTAPTVLHDVTFTLQPGLLYMCVGPVASGKSSLMASMLGEMTLLNGTIATSDHDLRIAYASQDAFIFPGTIRDNVLLGSTFDTARYNAVINACGLMPDITRLTKGDATVLGDRGVTLSGGQRQRV
ncbi:hypothetical protein FRC07_009306, partial [Ceratobasidium sp. 392]